MSGFWTGPRIVWAVLSAMYLVFLLWYDWSGGPLTSEEIDHYEALLQEQGLEGTVVPFTAREFAENDDGDEFFMVNLTIPREEPLIPDDLPEGEDPVQAAQRYTRETGLRMLAYANHPIASLDARVNFIEYEGAPVWDNLLLVRYRSRRDFFRVFAHPGTAEAIRYKFVFIAQDHSWPTETGYSLLGIRTMILTYVAMLGLVVHGVIIAIRRRSRDPTSA